MSIPRNTFLHGSLRVISAVFFSIILFELAYPAWTFHLTDAAYHTALAFLTIISASWSYNLARSDDQSVHSFFLSAFLFRSIIHIGSGVEHLFSLEIPWIKRPELLTLDMFELAVLSIVVSVAIMSKNNRIFKNIRLSRAPILILGLLAAYGVFYLILLPLLINTVIVLIGFILGIISIVALFNAIFISIRKFNEFENYEVSWLAPGLCMIMLSSFPILLSLSGIQFVWIISMALQACGFFCFSLSISIRVYPKFGMKVIPTYMLSAFTLLIAVIPILVFILSEYFFPGLVAVDQGAYLIIHAGAAALAGIMAILVFGQSTPTSSNSHYPLVLLFLVWMLSEIHLLLFWRGVVSEITSESFVPYLVGSIFSLIYLVRMNRWIQLRRFGEITGHPSKWFLPRLIFVIATLWFVYIFEESFLLYNPELEFNPLPRSLLLIGNLVAMFLFSILAVNLLRLRGDWRRIEIIATGILSLWIVPNILKGIFRDWTIGWWCSELILFLGLLWGPMILGMLYLESMVKEDESRRRASFYADLLVHDISNYHQAILLSLGLLEMNIENEVVLQQALVESHQSLQRAEQLVRNVKHIGMSDLMDGSNLYAVDVVYCIKEAFTEAISIVDMQYIEFYCPYEDHKYYVNANDNLVEVFINLIRNAIQYSPERKRIEFRIQQGIDNNEEILIIEIIDYGRGIDPKLKPSLFQEYSSDEFGPRVGLSVVQSIIHSYGGSVSLRDRIPGEYTQGSIFIVKIPAVSSGGSHG